MSARVYKQLDRKAFAHAVAARPIPTVAVAAPAAETKILGLGRLLRGGAGAQYRSALRSVPDHELLQMAQRGRLAGGHASLPIDELIRRHFDKGLSAPQIARELSTLLGGKPLTSNFVTRRLHLSGAITR